MIRTTVLTSAVFAIGLIAAGTAKEKLEFKYREGTTSKILVTRKVHQILSIAGMDIETRSQETVTASRSVGKRSADGRLPIRQKVESLAVQLSLPGGVELNFDSTVPSTFKNDNPMLQAVLDVFQVSAGAGYTIVLGKDNKVVAIEGTQEILDKASPAAAEALRKEVDPERIKETTNQELSRLPDSPVGAGDTWDRTETLHIGAGQTLTFQNQYKYGGTVEKGGKKLHNIEVTAKTVTYAIDPNSPSPIKVSKSDLKIDSSKSTILFDQTSGEIVESAGVTRVTGDMTLTAGGMELPSKLDLTFDSSSTHK